MMNTTTLQNDFSHKLLHQVAWRAILAGVVIGLVAEILLNLLGAGIGLTAFDVDVDKIATISIGSTIWFVIAGTISMFLSGWFTGRLAALHLYSEGALHGLMTWASISLIVFMLMASTAGSMIGGSVNLLGHGLRTANDATELVNELSSQTDARAQTVAAAENNAPNLASLTNQNAEQIKQKAIETAKKATDVLGVLAIVTFFVLMLGALAALLGGIVGVRSSQKISCPQTVANLQR